MTAVILAMKPAPGVPVLCFGEHHGDPLPGLIIRVVSSEPASNVLKVNVRVFGDPPNVPFNDETWMNVPLYPPCDIDALPVDGRCCMSIEQLVRVDDPEYRNPGRELPDAGLGLAAGLPGTESESSNPPSSSEAASQTQPAAKEGEQVPAGSFTPPSSESSTSAAG